MANQGYAKAKIALWANGYQAALEGKPRGNPRFAQYDAPWQNGYDKGLEVKKNIEDQGLSLNRE